MTTPHSPLDDDHARRFGGLDRLYGDGARMALHRSRMAVVGVGGVGSWVAEALARSGVGNITLIDFDHVAVSNVNRQVHALDSTLGMAKVKALEARIRDINPDCKVNAVDDFLTEENMGTLIPAGGFDAVVDACDSAQAKAALIIHARQNGTWLMICGATGGKSNPLKLCHSDLGCTAHDSLLLRVRKLLRSKAHILPRKNGKYGVDCLFVDEHTRHGGACTTGDLSCSGYGSVVTVTASMGLAAASLCVKHIMRTSGINPDWHGGSGDAATDPLS